MQSQVWNKVLDGTVLIGAHEALMVTFQKIEMLINYMLLLLPAAPERLQFRVLLTDIVDVVPRIWEAHYEKDGWDDILQLLGWKFETKCGPDCKWPRIACKARLLRHVMIAATYCGRHDVRSWAYSMLMHIIKESWLPRRHRSEEPLTNINGLGTWLLMQRKDGALVEQNDWRLDSR